MDWLHQHRLFVLVNRQRLIQLLHLLKAVPQLHVLIVAAPKAPKMMRQGPSANVLIMLTFPLLTQVAQRFSASWTWTLLAQLVETGSFLHGPRALASWRYFGSVPTSAAGSCAEPKVASDMRCKCVQQVHDTSFS